MWTHRPGSRLEADHPENGVPIARRLTLQRVAEPRLLKEKCHGVDVPVRQEARPRRQGIETLVNKTREIGVASLTEGEFWPSAKRADLEDELFSFPHGRHDDQRQVGPSVPPP